MTNMTECLCHCVEVQAQCLKQNKKTLYKILY